MPPILRSAILQYFDVKNECWHCQNELEHNQATDAKLKFVLQQGMDASTEDTMDTVASTGKVSQTLQTNLTLCVFAMLHTAQSPAYFNNTETTL